MSFFPKIRYTENIEGGNNTKEDKCYFDAAWKNTYKDRFTYIEKSEDIPNITIHFPYVVLFFTNWCGYCRDYSNIVKQNNLFTDLLKKNIYIYVIDADSIQSDDEKVSLNKKLGTSFSGSIPYLAFRSEEQQKHAIQIDQTQRNNLVSFVEEELKKKKKKKKKGGSIRIMQKTVLKKNSKKSKNQKSKKTKSKKVTTTRMKKSKVNKKKVTRK